MSFLDKYKTDKTAELEGVWVEMDAGVEVRVARLNNDKARAKRRELEKPYRNFREVPESVNEGILRKVVASTVLLDWKGLTDDAGAKMPYSAAKAEELFELYPDFLNDVVSVSMARETFQAAGAEAAKNA